MREFSVHLNHATLRCAPSQLSVVSLFYERVLGLTVGERPDFAFSGAWLYAGHEALLHLAAILPELPDSKPGDLSPPVAGDKQATTTIGSAATHTTGPIDHIAFRVTIPVTAMRARLHGLGVTFAEAPVPNLPLHQIFVVDPLGAKVELNFELAAAG